MTYEFGLSRRIYGVVHGVVTDNKHPDGAYRVKVKFPWIRSTDVGDDSDYVSSWARVASSMAGNGRGMYMLPEVDDEVVVSFVHGDIRCPVVLGCVWNDTDKQPVGGSAPKASTDPLGNDLGIGDAAKDNKEASGKNNARFMISRAGSVMMFDDTAGKEKIIFKTAKGSALIINDEKEVLAMYDHTKEVYLAMDATNKKITMETKNGEIHMLCKNGKFYVEAKEIITKASTKQEHKADTTWHQESGGKMTIKAGGTMDCDAPKIELN